MNYTRHLIVSRMLLVFSTGVWHYYLLFARCRACSIKNRCFFPAFSCKFWRNFTKQNMDLFPPPRKKIRGCNLELSLSQQVVGVRNIIAFYCESCSCDRVHVLDNIRLFIHGLNVIKIFYSTWTKSFAVMWFCVCMIFLYVSLIHPFEAAKIQ